MLKFNKAGNLSQNLNLSFSEFKKEFGYNNERKKLIGNAFSFLHTLKRFGTANVYITGSIVTDKKEPGDIDICWDTTGMDYKRCKKEYPEFFSDGGIEALRAATGIHIAAIFDSYSTDILEWYQFDRNGNFRGWGKIPLFNLDTT
jgi:hypothetical protein